MSNSDHSDAVDMVAEEVLQQLRQGLRPSLDDFVAKYPQLESELRDLFPSLLLMEHFGSPDITDGLPAGATNASGQRKLGDYTIIREIGRGGMGIVYEAEQPSLNRRVAVKVLSSGSRLRPQQVKRFDREARSVAMLEHPAIVPVYGIGADRGVPFYVMKYINGRGLDQVLIELRRCRGFEFAENSDARTRHAISDVTYALLRGVGSDSTEQSIQLSDSAGQPTSNGSTESATPTELPEINSLGDDPAIPLDASSVFPALSSASTPSRRDYYQTVARIGIQVAKALHYAHEQGILHRDIKPSNLMLDLLGHVWVTDFGLAKIRDEDDLTHTGEFVGTLRYTSPEQLRGWSDPRSDIYSLGVTLYELLTFRPAFPQDERASLLDHIAHRDPQSIRHWQPDLSRELATIVHKAMAKEPSRRYGSAQDLADDLQRFLDDKPILARPTSVQQYIRLWARRKPAVAALSTLLFLSLVTGLFVVSWLWRQADAEKKIANQESEQRRQEVYRASLAEARAIRLGHQSDLWNQALMAIQRAGDIDSTTELRNEAVNLLAANGPWLERRLDGPSESLIVGDAGQFHYVDPNHTIVTCSLSDGKELARWSHPAADGELIDLIRIRAMPGHAKFLVYEVAFSNGQKTCYILDTNKGELLLETRPIVACHFDRNQGQLVACQQQEIRCIPLGDPANTKEFIHDADVRAFDTHPHRSHAAFSQQRSDRVTILELETGAVVREIQLPADGHAVKWSPDGKTLATGCADGTICLWDGESGELRQKLTGHAGSVAEFSFHPDLPMLASAAWGTEVIIWKLRSGDVAKRFNQQRAIFSADGQSLITSYFSEIGVWRLQNENFLKEVAYDEEIEWPGISVSHDDSMFAIPTKEGFRLWDAQTLESAKVDRQLPVVGLAFHPRDDVLLTTGEAGVHRWSIGPIFTEAPVAEQILEPQSGHWLKFLTFSASGNRFAVLDDLRSTSVFDDVSNQLLYRVKNSQHERLSMVSLSPNGKLAATGTWVGRGVRVHRDDGTLVTELVPEEPNARAEFSPSGELLVVSTRHGVRAWDTKAWQPAWERPQPMIRTVVTPNRVRFSADGKMCVYRPARGMLRLVWAASGQEIVTLEHAERRNYSEICFAPDGNRLYGLVSEKKTIQIWELRSLNQQLRHWGLQWQ